MIVEITVKLGGPEGQVYGLHTHMGRGADEAVSAEQQFRHAVETLTNLIAKGAPLGTPDNEVTGECDCAERRRPFQLVVPFGGG